MGAVLEPRSSPPAPPKLNGRFLLGGLLLVVCALGWRDVVDLVNGEYQLKPKHKRDLQRKLDEDDKAEQYALIAVTEGWYPCTHSGFTQYYLRTGEVWKYGTTTKGEMGRYDIKFLRQNKVKYLVQFIGSENQCKREEQRKLYYYPVLPENLARPEEYRLIRPPFNPILR